MHRAIILAILSLFAPLVIPFGQSVSPVEYPNLPPQAGWTWFGGRLKYGGPCQSATFYIYAGEDTSGELLGSNSAGEYGPALIAYFYVYLNRPFREGETITVYAECYGGVIVHDTFVVAPFVSPPGPLHIYSTVRSFVYPTQLQVSPGSRVLRGKVERACAGVSVSLYPGVYPPVISPGWIGVERLGTGTVEADGSFRIDLQRPLQEGEVLTLYGDQCLTGDGPIQVLRHISAIINVPSAATPEPPIIPEPTTLALVSGGLGLLAMETRHRLRSRPGQG